MLICCSDYLSQNDSRYSRCCADKKVNHPIVEALTLEMRTGVSFSSTGQIITEHQE